MQYGKRANHVRYIKQVTDSKGRFTKDSAVVTYGRITLQDSRPFTPDKFQSNYWSTFRYDRLAYIVGLGIGFIILWATLGGKV
jgi:hypothetical protein